MRGLPPIIGILRRAPFQPHWSSTEQERAAAQQRRIRLNGHDGGHEDRDSPPSNAFLHSAFLVRTTLGECQPTVGRLALHLLQAPGITLSATAWLAVACSLTSTRTALSAAGGHPVVSGFSRTCALDPALGRQARSAKAATDHQFAETEDQTSGNRRRTCGAPRREHAGWFQAAVNQPFLMCLVERVGQLNGDEDLVNVTCCLPSTCSTRLLVRADQRPSHPRGAQRGSRSPRCSSEWTPASTPGSSSAIVDGASPGRAQARSPADVVACGCVDASRPAIVFALRPQRNCLSSGWLVRRNEHSPCVQPRPSRADRSPDPPVSEADWVSYWPELEAWGKRQ